MRCCKRIFLFSVISIIVGQVGAEERVPKLDYRTATDPQLILRDRIPSLPKKWRKIWYVALTAAEEDLRRECAEALILEVHRGNTELADFHDPLRQALSTSRIHEVRMSLATALIVLGVSDAAQELAEFSDSGGPRARFLVEPALAQWEFSDVESVWLQRISRPQECSAQDLLLAVRGLSRSSDQEVPESLIDLVRSRQLSTEVRLAAADALGRLTTDGLTQTAAGLYDGESAQLAERLAAVRMIRGHRSDEDQSLLLRMASDDVSAVVVEALRQLVAQAPRLVLADTDRFLEHSDAEARRLMAEALAASPSHIHIQKLTRQLIDPHPDVRNQSRRLLRNLAADVKWRTTINTAADAVLAAEDWRGQEQAARLLGSLNHEPAATRLLELMRADRREVRVTTAWALRNLAVEETLPAVHVYLQELLSRLSGGSGQRLDEADDACMGHLFELVGQLKYQPAEPQMLQCVPKRYDIGRRARSAAIWALGWLYEGGSNQKLLQMLVSRVSDDAVINPEYQEVRAASAISLGRLGDAEAVEALRTVKTLSEPGGRIHESTHWALERLLGEVLPEAVPAKSLPKSPFLKTLD